MELALDDPRFKEKRQGQNPYAINGPLAPKKPGMGEEFGNMVKQRAMEKSLNYGQEKLVDGVTSLNPTAADAIEFVGAQAGSILPVVVDYVLIPGAAAATNLIVGK